MAISAASCRASCGRCSSGLSLPSRKGENTVVVRGPLRRDRHSQLERRSLPPRCLNSLEELDYPRDLLEVIVVDNGPTDTALEHPVARGRGSRRLFPRQRATHMLIVDPAAVGVAASEKPVARGGPSRRSEDVARQVTDAYRDERSRDGPHSESRVGTNARDRSTCSAEGPPSLGLPHRRVPALGVLFEDLA